jgi:hypothetical protein
MDLCYFYYDANADWNSLLLCNKNVLFTQACAEYYFSFPITFCVHDYNVKCAFDDSSLLWQLLGLLQRSINSSFAMLLYILGLF